MKYISERKIYMSRGRGVLQFILLIELNNKYNTKNMDVYFIHFIHTDLFRIYPAEKRFLFENV